MPGLGEAIAALLLFAASIAGGLETVGEGFEVACIAAGGDYQLTSRHYDGQWECVGLIGAGSAG